jgi:Fe2+ or Zn2+ uptake regulation protein
MSDCHDTVEIDLDDEPDRWRYTCPHGHRDWEATNDHVYCRACAQYVDHDDEIDPSHRALVDQRTGRTIPRERIRFRAAGGNWRAAGDSREGSA